MLLEVFIVLAVHVTIVVAFRSFAPSPMYDSDFVMNTYFLTLLVYVISLLQGKNTVLKASTSDNFPRVHTTVPETLYFDGASHQIRVRGETEAQYLAAKRIYKNSIVVDDSRFVSTYPSKKSCD